MKYVATNKIIGMIVIAADKPNICKLFAVDNRLFACVVKSV